MKDYLKVAGAILLVLGWASMLLAVVSGVGYGLYLLGVVGLTFGPAAWLGFVVWLKMTIGGFLALVIGACLAA